MIFSIFDKPANSSANTKSKSKIEINATTNGKCNSKATIIKIY
jgi:hypothetical protein